MRLIKGSNKGSIQSLLPMAISCYHDEDFIYSICIAYIYDHSNYLTVLTVSIKAKYWWSA